MSIRASSSQALQMSTDSLVLAATPTVEEWLEVCEPGLRKVFIFRMHSHMNVHALTIRIIQATLGMFRACKEIAYKIRTASCDKMSCFNEFGMS